MSPISPHRPSASLDHMATHHTLRQSLPNIKLEIPSDDIIDTIHQFNQQQRENDVDALGGDYMSGGSNDDDDEHDMREENDENDESKFFNQKQLNSDDIIVPVSSNNQPNLQYPPSYQYTDNGSTISFMNSKLQKTTSRNAISSITNTELYPALQFETNFITTIPESFSNSTISSYDSAPPTLTHSITNSFSNASLQMSPQQQQQQQQQQQTPLRLNRKHSISSGVATVQTPLQLHTSNIPQYQTPLRKTPSITPHRKGHLRTRSRLSLDANGSAVISINGSSATTLKSPGGVNPFYTPPAFVSPRTNSIDSPQQLHLDSNQQMQTPFATPLHPAAMGSDRLGVSPYLLLRKDDSHKLQKRFRSNEFNDFTKAADLSLQLADKLMNNSNDSVNLSYMVDNTNHPEGLESHIIDFQHNHHNQFTPEVDSISRSRTSMNLSTTLMNSPSSSEQNHTSGQHLQFIPMHHSHNVSIPQNIYHQFDKLNFIPEIQHQPYAPLVQFPQLIPTKQQQEQQEQQQHQQQHQLKQHDEKSLTSQDDEKSKVEIVVQDKKEKKQKIHQCPLCGGRFQRPEHVKRHMRSHSSEKPFMCGICNKRFNRNDNMKAHERKIHGIDKSKKLSSE